jgi:hypothetical protein
MPMQPLTRAPSPVRSAAALSALAHAMSESSSVGVVRFSLRVRSRRGCRYTSRMTRLPAEKQRLAPWRPFAGDERARELFLAQPVALWCVQLHRSIRSMRLPHLASAEDLRMHEFAPLPPDDRSEPTVEACAAAEALVDSMMFRDAAGPPRSFAATGDWTALHNPTMRCVPFSATPCESMLTSRRSGASTSS